MQVNALSRTYHLPAAFPPSVRHYLPGGCESGGGIGRLVGYISESAKEADRKHLVTDTRGRKWSFATSPSRLLIAIITMTKDRIAAPGRIHHIHVAGRGSTSRKLILTGVARFLGCHHILHLHDYDYARDFAERTPRQQMRIRRMFQGADHVVVLGNRDHLTLTGDLGVDPRRITVMRNCVPDPWAKVVRVTKNRQGKLPLIIFLGRLSERKGVPELLLALSHPLMRELGWKAVVAGDGPVEDYRRQATALALSEVVEMPGWLGADEARNLCSQADILVLPSYAEGMAMAIIEGLAHGLAVVTTRVGAHEEVILDGETGVFVPVGDKDALAMALAKLVQDREQRNRLAVQGRLHYLDHFSMKTYMRSLENLYDAVSAQLQTSAGAS